MLQMKDKVSFSVRKMATALSTSSQFREQQKTVSHMTVSRHLRRQTWGKVAHLRPTKPLLSAKNIRDRMTFCN